MWLPVAFAIAVATPFTSETACLDHDLQVIAVAPAEQSANHRSSLEKRLRDVSGEEQRLVQAAAKSQVAGQVTVPMGLGIGGILLVALASLRRKHRWILLGTLLITAGTGLTLHALERDRQAQIRIGQVRSCLLKLRATQQKLAQAEYSRCRNDIGEAEEDLLMFQARIGAGQPISLQQVVKLRQEMTHQR